MVRLVSPVVSWGFWGKNSKWHKLNPKGSMGLVYLPTFTIKINQKLVYIPYMDPMGMAFFMGETPG